MLMMAAMVVVALIVSCSCCGKKAGKSSYFKTPF